jgi:hypothetical protein
MSDKVTAIIQSVSDAVWFSSVGNATEDDEVIQVMTWQEAIARLATYADERLYVVPTNQIRYLLRERAAKEYQKWNAVANGIRPEITQLVERKTEGALTDPAATKLLRDYLAWDIMHACMESEYENVCTIHYHRKRVALLQKGHCPCGWQGEFPQGKHLIY